MRTGLFWRLHRALRALFWCGWIAVAVFLYTQRAALQPAVDFAELMWNREPGAPELPFLSGRVTKLYDGDSFQIRDDQGWLSNYGLAGVAVPRVGPNTTPAERAAAAASLTAMTRLIEGERIEVRVTLANPQNRTGLGLAWVQGTNLNEFVLTNGWGRLNRVQIRGAPLREQYRLVRAERLAQRRGAGLWSAVPRDPVGTVPKP